MGLFFACPGLALAGVPGEAGGPHRGGHETKQVLVEHPADIFDVVGRESHLIRKAFRDVALRTIGLDGQLRATHPVARHGGSDFRRNGTRELAGFRLFT